MREARQESADVGTLLLWVVLTAVGFTLGTLGGDWLARALAAPLAAKALLRGAVRGLLVGVGQWEALRRRFPGVWPWIPATVLAFALYMAAYEALPGGALVRNLLSGALVGGSQWLVLRSRLERAGAWIWTTAVTWCFVGLIAAALYRQLPSVPLALAGASLFLGAFTGAALLVLLRRAPATAG